MGADREDGRETALAPGALATYVADHLTGAQFAVQLLADLRDHSNLGRVKQTATELLAEIEADREQLLAFAERTSGGSSTAKEAAAWVVQKLSRFKLAPDDPLGVFEAIETLSLGILGKRALWTALQAIGLDDDLLTPAELDRLVRRAADQHQRAEALRLALAIDALRSAPPSAA